MEIKKEQLGDQIDNLEGQIDSYELEVYRLEDEMSILQEQILLSEDAITTAEDLVEQYQVELEDAQARLLERQELLSQRLVSLYVYGDVNIWDVLTGTSSFRDFLSVFDMTSFIMDQAEVLLNQVKEETANIEELKSAAEDALAEQERVQAQLLDQKNELNQKQSEYYGLIDQTNVSLAELDAIYEETEAAAVPCPHWVDMAGMFAPAEETAKLLNGIKTGILADIGAINSAFERINKSYSANAKAWALWALSHRLGHNPTQEEIANAVATGAETADTLASMMNEDSLKDDSQTMRTGYGIDARDRETVDADFEAVRKEQRQ